MILVEVTVPPKTVCESATVVVAKDVDTSRIVVVWTVVVVTVRLLVSVVDVPTSMILEVVWVRKVVSVTVSVYIPSVSPGT